MPKVATTNKPSDCLKLMSSTIVFPKSWKPICSQTVLIPSKFVVPNNPTVVPTRYKVSFANGIIAAVLHEGPFPDPEGNSSRLPAIFSHDWPPSKLWNRE